MVQLYLNTSDAYKKLNIYRSSVISAEDPGLTPGTTEALKYVVFNRVCDTQPQQTIKKGTAKKDKPGAGWRRIEGTDIWFESAWHANYARFLAGMEGDKTVWKWLYKPRRFKIEFFGYYIPTFYVNWNGSWMWVETDVHKHRIGLLANLFEVDFPEEKLWQVNKSAFQEKEDFFNYAIPEWE